MKIKIVLNNVVKQFIAEIKEGIISRKNDNEQIIYDKKGIEYSDMIPLK